jgi:hypothetical protein
MCLELKEQQEEGEEEGVDEVRGIFVDSFTG